MKNKESLTVYMDLVDWQYEVADVTYGTKVYPDLEAMKEHNPCFNSCGVIRCTLTANEIVIPQDWDKGTYKTFSAEELAVDPDKQRLEAALKRKEYLESVVKQQDNHIEQLKLKIKENKNEN